jgi:S1-C subfamily serine protease
MIGAGARRRLVGVAIALAIAAAPARADEPPPARTPPPGHDLTFRPTVIVRRGKHQGSGTVIASIPGESLVLTASHVLEGDGPLYIEVHRYNLGLERRQPAAGWPREVPARVVALDKAADLAVIRVTGFEAMPYVARIAPGPGEPPRGEAVVSVGIDLGETLASWGSRVFDYARIDMGNGGGPRPFLLVEKPPEHGRSGGGLFTTDGTVVGVCVGRAEVVRGRRFGVFASSESIRRILSEHDLEAAVARSAARRRPRPAPSAPAPVPHPPPPAGQATSG